VSRRQQWLGAIAVRGHRLVRSFGRGGARAGCAGSSSKLLEEELEAALGQGRYERGTRAKGRHHSHRPRQLATTFGPLLLSVPRARCTTMRASRTGRARCCQPTGTSAAAPRPILRVRRATAKLFESHIGKDIVSRASQKPARPGKNVILPATRFCG
jgi:putative transposase